MPRILWFESIMRDARCDIRVYLQPAFVICAVVLIVSSVVISKIEIEPEPWPLKKPLDLLDEDDLAPYKVIEKIKIQNEEIVEALGTKDYIQWVLEDTDEAAGSNVKKCLLFITYYELADRIPHETKECHLGTGHQLLAEDGLSVEINGQDGNENIPGRHLVFSRTNSGIWHRGTKFSVFYLFSVNRIYANSRDSARLALNRNIFSKHSYFSKVEWNFLTNAGVKTYLSKEKAVAASEKLLAVVLPILERDHWPEWEKAVE